MEIFWHLYYGEWSCGFRRDMFWSVGRMYYNGWWYHLNLGWFWVNVYA